VCEKVQIKGLVQATSEFQTIMSAAGTLASNIFGFKFNEQDPESVVFLEKYVPKFTQQINSITEEDLRAVLTKAQKEGWAVTKIRDEIRAVFNGYTKDRAELIARTEVIRSSNMGAKMAYKQAGVREIVWLTAKDERTCPICRPLDGKVIGIEQDFFKVGDVIEGDDGKPYKVTYENISAGGPIHPGCRCTCVPR
jgi:SPP1 gp7 family putative phage head morphogenesis protein